MEQLAASTVTPRRFPPAPEAASLHRDAWGNPLLSTSAQAVRALDEAVRGLVEHRADTGTHLDRALAHDPRMVVALVMRGFALQLLGRNDLLPEARALCGRARAALDARGSAGLREAALVDALERWCRGDRLGTMNALEEILWVAPCDLLAIKLAHACHFLFGHTARMRLVLERVLPAWPEGAPGRGYVLGCLAFALEEEGEYALAERIGREAVALCPRDAWATHAVAHVYEMLDRPRAGLAWLLAAEPHLFGASNFAGHIAWHRALFHLALGQVLEALSLYDKAVAIYPARDYRDVANAATLLYRLEEDGVSVDDRWRPLVEAARARLGDHGSAFADVHYVLVLAMAGELDDARQMVRSMARAAAGRPTLDASPVPPALLSARGIVALRSGEPARALELLGSARGSARRLGGSNAQRDILAQLQVRAAIEAGADADALRLLCDRIAVRPENAWAHARLLEVEHRGRGRAALPESASRAA